MTESFTMKHWHSSSGSTLCSHNKIVQEEKDCLSVFFSTFTVLQSITVTKTQLIRHHNKSQCCNLILNLSYFPVNGEITKTYFLASKTSVLIVLLLSWWFTYMGSRWALGSSSSKIRALLRMDRARHSSCL